MRAVSAIFISLSLVLAACGGDSDSSSETTSGDTTAPETTESQAAQTTASQANTTAEASPPTTAVSAATTAPDDTEPSPTTATPADTSVVETTEAPTETAIATPDTTSAPVESTSTTAAAPVTTTVPETTVVAGGSYEAVLGSPEGGEFSLGAPTALAVGNITFSVTNEGSFPHDFAMVAGNGYDQLPLRANGQPDEEALRNAGGWFGVTELLSGGDSTTIDFADVPAGNYVLFCNIAVGASSHAAQGQVLSVTVS